MQIKLSWPYALNEQGKRDNSEDSIFPQKGAATQDSPFFLVCDGVGGYERGEVASQSVCRAFDSFLGNKALANFGQEIFGEALDYAYAQLDSEDTAGDESKKMGTTLTFACFHEGGVFLAHIGDSRIYHLRRQGKLVGILYKSRDHSHVGELVRAGIITETEAESHPKKNVLTRVMQPNQEKRSKADCCEVSDVKTGDYFFMCTDGILESVNDDLLCEIIGSNGSDEAKIKAIHDACKAGSRDNFSAYLIPVASVDGAPEAAPEKKRLDDDDAGGVAPPVAPSARPDAKPDKKWLVMAALALCTCSVVFLLCYFFQFPASLFNSAGKTPDSATSSASVPPKAAGGIGNAPDKVSEGRKRDENGTQAAAEKD
jgi:protein phosphatase